LHQALGRGAGFARQAPADPREIELQGGEALTKLVVDLARDPRALVFANRLDPRRERTQLLVELRALDRDPREVGRALDELAIGVRRNARFAVVGAVGAQCAPPPD